MRPELCLEIEKKNNSNFGCLRKKYRVKVILMRCFQKYAFYVRTPEELYSESKFAEATHWVH